MATATLIVRHQVEDYAAWRAVYETVEGLRGQHGCTGAEVMVDPGNKQDVFILHRFPTVEQAEAYHGQVVEGMRIHEPEEYPQKLLFKTAKTNATTADPAEEAELLRHLMQTP